MKTGILFKKWTAVLCAVLMMISLFAIPAFADEAASGQESSGIDAGLLIGLIIAAVILVVAVVLCIRFRENIGKFFRVYKSEAKKVVWLPWNQTKKSTLVVLVVLIAFAVAICLIDLALSRSFLKFVDLLSK